MVLYFLVGLNNRFENSTTAVFWGQNELSAYFKPIRSKTTSNRNLHSRGFPLIPVACFCLDLWMVHCMTNKKSKGHTRTPGPRSGQYLTHAHSHITREVAAMDSRFVLVSTHHHGIDVEPYTTQKPFLGALCCRGVCMHSFKRELHTTKGLARPRGWCFIPLFQMK